MLAAVLAFAAPLVVAAIVLRSPQWYPVADLAQIELRVRDVPTTNPPLLGLGGRIGQFGEAQGSHPGPLAFFALWPVYALFGSTAWAFQVASLALHLAAIGVALWLAHRRGGAPLVLGVAAVLAVLARGYGAELLAEPWNPYVPVLWFVVFVLAVWSVVSDDLFPLVVVVVAGSLCVQSHLPYAAVVGAGSLLAVGGTAVHLRRRWHDREDRPRTLRALVLGVAAAVVVWAPPLAEQFGSSTQGNLTRIWRYFRDPPEAALGVPDGVQLLLRLLDPWRLVAADVPTQGYPVEWSIAPGAAFLAVWLLGVVVAWRMRHGALLRLDLVLGVLLVAAVVALSRIFGPAWNYLSLWVWGVHALMAMSIVWTAGAAVGSRRPPGTRLGRWAQAGPVVVAAVALALLTNDAATAAPPSERLSDLIAGLAPQAAERLDDDDVPGGGRGGRYLYAFTDPVNGGFAAAGVFNELERRGYELGMSRQFRAAVTPHRLLEREAATAELHYAVGADVDVWRRRPGAVEIAAHDPRDAAERAEFEELRAELAAELPPGGDDRFDDLLGLLGDPELTALQRLTVTRMVDLGSPVSLFVAPVQPGP